MLFPPSESHQRPPNSAQRLQNPPDLPHAHPPGDFWGHLELFDGLPTLPDDQSCFSRWDHQLLDCPVLAIGGIGEGSRGAPSAPGHDVIQQRLRLPGEGLRGHWGDLEVLGEIWEGFGVTRGFGGGHLGV